MPLKDIPDIIMLAAPAHARGLMRLRVRMLAKAKVTRAAITTKIAVQMALFDSALNAMEILSMAEPEIKVKTDGKY